MLLAYSMCLYYDSLCGLFFLFFYHFIASYLPKPSCQEYEFVYVDAKGEVCSRSSKFTFCAPKPLEELETLKEEEDEEDGDEELLLVIPRAQLLQVGVKLRINITKTAKYKIFS